MLVREKRKEKALDGEERMIRLFEQGILKQMHLKRALQLWESLPVVGHLRYSGVSQGAKQEYNVKFFFYDFLNLGYIWAGLSSKNAFWMK